MFDSFQYSYVFRRREEVEARAVSARGVSRYRRWTWCPPPTCCSTPHPGTCTTGTARTWTLVIGSNRLTYELVLLLLFHIVQIINPFLVVSISGHESWNLPFALPPVQQLIPECFVTSVRRTTRTKHFICYFFIYCLLGQVFV